MHLKQNFVQSVDGLNVALKLLLISNGKNPLMIAISVSKPCFYMQLVK